MEAQRNQSTFHYHTVYQWHMAIWTPTVWFPFPFTAILPILTWLCWYRFDVFPKGVVSSNFTPCTLLLYVYTHTHTHTHTYVYTHISGKVKLKVTQSRLTLCNPMDCSLPGSSVHGIFQTRILEWVTVPFSRGSSQPRDWSQVYRGERFRNNIPRNMNYIYLCSGWHGLGS